MPGARQDGIPLVRQRGLPVGQVEEVNLGRFQHPGAFGQEPADVLGGLVPAVRIPVAVQLVEDPLPGMPADRVAGVDQRARLGLPDLLGGLGYQLVEGILGTSRTASGSP